MLKRITLTIALLVAGTGCKMPSTGIAERQQARADQYAAIKTHPCVLTASSGMNYSVTYRDADDVEQVQEMDGGFPFFYGFTPRPRQRLSIRVQVHGTPSRDLFGNQMDFPSVAVAIWSNGQIYRQDDRGGNPRATSALVVGIW